MKINITNLGAIEEVRIDLKPLTIFIGENGTGKTWTVYAIAGILGVYGFNYYRNEYLEGRTEYLYKPIEDAISNLIEKGNAKINVIQFAQEFIEIYLNEIAKLAPGWLNSFLATKRVSFNNLSISAELPDNYRNNIMDKLKASHVKAKKSIGAKSILVLNTLKEKNSEELYYYTKSENENSDEIPEPVIKEEVRDFVFTVTFTIIRNALFPNTPILPTERSTFITFPFPAIQNENHRQYEIKKKNVIKDNENILISEPVRNFLEILKSSLKEYFNRKIQETYQPEISKFIQLANLLESDILFGDIDFEQYGENFELIHKLSKDTNLELNISSSMVKELAPLALYLKYLAQPGDLLVIDEPEMNLHPAAQAEITEFLGMLSNAGLYILITTHSPYIVDHLVNLIYAKKDNKGEKITKDFFLEKTDSFISKENVAVYLFENKTAENALTENGEINWGTFSDVSHDISSVYAKLIN
ncbi:MAG: AAA family ATPase [Desulfobacteraceae bacterium]|nr:AAA family ATPase [Desulfobacteraceae bacterium]